MITPPPSSQSQRQTRSTNAVRKFVMPRTGATSIATIKNAKPSGHKLPPGDPEAVAGCQPLVNVIETDVDYTMQQNDYAVLAQGTVTVTLTENPLTVTPVLIIADSGTVTIDGGANPIQGGPVTVVQGTMTFLSFSPLSEEWSVLAAVGAGGIGNIIFVATGTTDAEAGQTLACETNTGPITIDMPVMPLNKTIEVVDYDANAAANNITVTPPPGWQIMDPNTLMYAAVGVSIVMNVDGGSATFASDGGRNNRLFIV